MRFRAALLLGLVTKILVLERIIDDKASTSFEELSMWTEWNVDIYGPLQVFWITKLKWMESA